MTAASVFLPLFFPLLVLRCHVLEGLIIYRRKFRIRKKIDGDVLYVM